MPARVADPVVPLSFGDAAAVVIVEKRRERANGKAAKRLTPNHWRDALLNVQFANAAYGGGGAVEGEQQPIVRELPAQAPIPEGVDLANIADLAALLTSSGKVLRSEFVTHHGTDTEGWLCLYADPDGKNHIVVAMRGSSSLADARTDLKAWRKTFDDPEKEVAAAFERYKPTMIAPATLRAMRFHSGFFHQYESVAVCIEERVREMVTICGDAPPDFLITGHSMGGALARLACLDLMGKGIAQKGSTRLCTLGCSPTGNRAVADAIDKLLGVDEDASCNLHIVNNNDPVPVLFGCCLFAWSGNFVHGGGTFIWISDTGKLKTTALVGNHRRRDRYSSLYCCCLPNAKAAQYGGFDHMLEGEAGYLEQVKKVSELRTKGSGGRAELAPPAAPDRNGD